MLHRRTFLRAAGVSVALPLLESFAPRARAAAAAPPIRRMVCMNTTLGIYGENLIPKAAGADYEATPYLEVLRDFRDQTTVFSGVSHPDVDGGHSSEACYLTAAPHPGSSSFRNSISLDQFVAEKFGTATRIGSLVLSTNNGSAGLSFNRSGVMLPADNKPSAVFKKLFVDGTPAEVRQQVVRLKEGQSIMDTVLERTKKLQATVGAADRARLDQYFTSVREVEQRLVEAEAWANKPKPAVGVKPPVDIAEQTDIVGRTKLLFDLTALALQTDSTRVVTAALWGMNSVPVIPGVSQDWHNLSHHGKDPAKIAELGIIEKAQFECLRELLAKLKSIPDQGATLLDHTMLLYGSNLGNAASHDTRNLPIVLFGGGFKHGKHLAFDLKQNAPLCRVFVSMLQRLGLEIDEFASGRGPIPGLELA